MLTRIKRLILGKPIYEVPETQKTLPKWKALALLSSDVLSSVAYATEEMLIPLAAFSAAALVWSIPISFGIVIILLLIATAYRQTISDYPQGGSAYVVARENLGTRFGLVAGAALLIEYCLTVAVSVSASVAAVGSAFPWVLSHREGFAVGAILVLMLSNLRGNKGSVPLFAYPTYLFIFSIIAMIVVGVWKIMTGQAVPAAPLIHEVYPAIPALLIFRAFSSGCTALTGIETISNGMSVFQPPVQKNAKITLAWVATILGFLFIGITFLAHLYGVGVKENETALSVLARSIFGNTGGYYIVQLSTALILLLAANTGYTGFPRLASLLAHDRYLPRQLASVGDRLVFSNGIIGLSVVAVALLLIFDAQTHRLIPLYAVGVFLSIALSQTGMVLKHWRSRKENWKSAAAVSGVGAATALIVLLVIAGTKLTHGAWVVFLLIAFLYWEFTQINRHYLAVGKALTLVGVEAPPKLEPLRHTVIVPISGVHRGVVEALRYALSISHDVRAVYTEIDPAAADRMKAEWQRWAHEIPLVILKSPNRSVIAPLLEYIRDLGQVTQDDMITVIIPEFVTAHWTHRFLHNQTSLQIRAALAYRRRVVVTSVRYHLAGKSL